MTIDPLTITNPNELAEFLKGRDEDELVEYLVELGVGDVLRTVFISMVDAYLPEAGPRERSVVQWEIQDPRRGLHTWQIAASRDGFAVQAGVIEEPDVTLRTDLVPFLRIVARDLRGLEVLCSGVVKLKGDIRLAIGMDGWFPDAGRESGR